MKGTRKRIIFTVTGFIRNKEIRRKFIDKEIKRFSKWKNAIKLRCIWWADIIEKLMEVEETKLSEVRNDSMHGRERNKDFCRKNMIKYLQTTIRNIKSNWFLWLLWKEGNSWRGYRFIMQIFHLSQMGWGKRREGLVLFVFFSFLICDILQCVFFHELFILNLNFNYVSYHCKF